VEPSQSQELMGAVAALSRTATGQVAVDDLLRSLVDLAARHLQVDGAGAMVCQGEVLAFVHASSTAVDHLEQLQALRQQGPCRDAVSSLREVVVADVHAPHPVAWQAYVAGARQVGLGSVLAVPLLSRGLAWGVLDLYRTRPGPWAEPDVAAARLLADVAASYVVMARDRDLARQTQRELAHRSLHDELTGLPNRALLFDRIEHALAAATRHDQTVAVFFIDLDRFKQINDTFGHAGGDTVLVQATARIAASLRQEDTFGRLAGDEFVVICEQLPQRTDGELDTQLRAVTARIHAALARPFEVGGVELVVSASVGVALSEPGSTGDDLLAEADAAMYRAKQRRHDELTIRRFESSLSRTDTRQLERELASALVGGQLCVHYQPIVSASDRRVVAVEALLRWQHPTRGLLAAADFIGLAESTGLIAPIGRWTIGTTCGQMQRWRTQLGPDAPGTAYVNLSARELADAELPDTLFAALTDHDLTPDHLGLELLEGSFIDPHLVAALQTLHQLGHPLSVDDFGTGYSSLSRLIQLPVTGAKVDKSFTAAIEVDPRARALVDAVLLVADELDLQVVGEGVENARQAALLTEAGCPLLQGRHFGAPQDADALTAAWSR